MNELLQELQQLPDAVLFGGGMLAALLVLLLATVLFLLLRRPDLEVDEMKSKFGIALLWVLVFLLGGVAGAVSHFLYQEHAKPATNAKIPPKPTIFTCNIRRSSPA